MPISALVVDKSSTVDSFIADALNDYCIILAIDGIEAIHQLKMHADVGLIILTLNIDNSDGFQILKLISENIINENIRIIVLSDSDSTEDELKCLRLGAHDYIRKSVQIQTLKYRVKNQLEIVGKQKVFEKEAINAELTFDSVFQQAPIGIAISHNSEPFSDGRENLINVNKMFEQICGRTKDELLELGWAKITHPDDLEEDLKMFNKLQSGKISHYSMNKRYIKPDGSIVWVNMVVADLKIKNDNQYNHICIIQDITEQKVILSQLEENKELLRTFIDSSQDFIFIKDDNLRHIIANKSLAEYYGLNVSEITGKTDYEFLDKEFADNCHITDWETIHTNSTVNIVEMMNNKIYETRKFPVIINNGKTGVGAYIRDITNEYKQSEIINKISETNRIITQCMLKPFVDIQEQLDFALHEALKLTESQYGYIYLYDESTREFTLNSWTNDVMNNCYVIEKRTKYQLDKTGLWGEVVRQRKPIIINDFDASNPLKKGYPKGHVVIHKYMSIPIFENDRIVAVIGLANRTSDYTDNDVHTMTVLMSGVWIATKKREKEKETEMLLERMQAMFNNHEAVMLLIEPVSGKIIEANSAATGFYGYSKEELLNMTIQDINMLNSDESKELRLKALNKGQKYFMFPHRLKDGTVKTVDVYSSPIRYDGKKVLFSIIFDVTKRENARKQIDYLANHDYLTGLYNRRFFEEEFRKINENGTYPVSVLIGDVNGLKLYNDTYGHQEGDRALKDIARDLKNCINNGNILARVGGDEFAVIISGAKETEVKNYLENLEQQVNYGKESTKLKALTISFGYGIQRQYEDSLDTLMIEAETFMYNRKYFNSRSARSNVVNAIMNTLFAKSSREKEHSERVSLISEAIATKLQLDKQSINEIRIAGLLHDIGKIGIDEKILNKTGKLDKNEWETMKLHSAKGAAILENTIEFSGITDYVLSHHERYNGSGYPKGLKGEEIPMASRIIAVADSYDAMTHNRSYRNKMNHETAVEELKQGSGTLFDPEIVSVFINEVCPDITLE